MAFAAYSGEAPASSSAPSPIAPAFSRPFRVVAAIQIGISGRTGVKFKRAPRICTWSPSRSTVSPRSSRRIASTYSFSVGSGSVSGTPFRSACLAVYAPSTSTMRPPDSSSRVAAVCAITSGLRSFTTWVVPSCTRDVDRAIAESAEAESRFVKSVSEKNAMSNPCASAADATSASPRTSTEGS
ncbi:hypothetical protein GCM10025877_24070 [Agromyces mangrovi Wang et al. 2018]|nr:hypothetical protein [Agromyces mangrovi]BDZ65469.1 hypothetical protein GCM10025877_24070 [Agromyces mangrovi]